MSQRSRSSRVRQHVHCDSCYSRRCRARVEASVCCALVPCRLLCGAVFHLCKEEDHLLLCPNVRVPCINAEFGCPLQMCRSSRAQHLQACPASVISCSMEWNRWPANDAHSHPNTQLFENLIVGREQGGCLDLAMALKDQDRLFHSLKMKKLFPELVQSAREEEKEEEERKEKKRKERLAAMKAERDKESHTWESFNPFAFGHSNEDGEEEDEGEKGFQGDFELTQEEREALATEAGVKDELLVQYNAWEHMFSMEMGGCREAKGAAEAGRGRGRGRGRGQGLDAVSEEDTGACSGAAASGACAQVSRCAAAQTSSCVGSRGKFVYERIEPMKIIAVRTFKIPSSFSAKQGRIRNPGFYRRESKAVDTSDLGVAPEHMPIWEEVQASLLCSLEKEQRGHLIAESICTDGLLQDEGTQTYNFLSVPFGRNSSLSDLTASKPLELHLQLQVESVTSRHHKASSAFTFLCGHTFQRREYGKHYKNVHSDIQMCVNGWFEQRCPLAYLGCTHTQRRFRPSTHPADVTYNEDLGCFQLQPTSPPVLGSNEPPECSADPPGATRRRRGGRAVGGGDPLSSLPYEVLCHMAGFLDSLSLSQLALVSQLMREVCSTQLQERGMVTLQWERKTYSHGRAKWRVKHKVWQFSTLFSPVDAWCFRDTPSMSEHLKVCPFYEREPRSERTPLPPVTEAQAKTGCKGPTLVTLFQQKRIAM